MKVLDLFSGIGGFSLGLEWAGMETVTFCEMDKFCQKVLKKHWPDVPIYDDIRKLDGKQFYGTIDVICGGFPCQPFSVAGKQRGKDDNRHLWPEMFRIIKEAKPTWVIGENVPGIINMALDEVCVDLESEGYEVQTFIIPACAVNAPHRRDRVWIIAHSKHNGRAAAEKQRNDSKALAGCEKGQGCAQQSKGVCPPAFMADTNCTGCEKLNSPALAARAGFSARPFATVEYRGDIEPTICRNDDGIPDRVDKLKSLGNAVVPWIPAIIGKFIIQLNKELLNEDCVTT